MLFDSGEEVVMVQPDLALILEKVEMARQGKYRADTRMTDAQVIEALRDAARRIWNSNSSLQEIDRLIDEIELLESMHEVVASRPVLLQPVADSIQEESQQKVKRVQNLLAQEGVKRDLQHLRHIVNHIKEFMKPKS
jgi:hypothetical protein